MKSVCLAILNYNGRKHLEHLLPTALEATQHYPGECSVLVLDNRSTEPDVAWINQHFPAVRVVVAPQNDFLFSYNRLLAELKEDVVVLLNNDMRVREDFIAPLVNHLESPDVFAASARSYNWDGTATTTGPSELVFKNGFYGWPFNVARQQTAHTLFCSGACMAVDRRKFLELGGFNRLFYPAYCEDLELCFCAWRRGWRCLYEPASVVWHREHASWDASELSRPNRLALRNALLFQWSTLPMERQRWRRRWSISKLFLGSMLRLDFIWMKTFFPMLLHWLQVRNHYRSMKASQDELDSIVRQIQAPQPSVA